MKKNIFLMSLICLAIILPAIALASVADDIGLTAAGQGSGLADTKAGVAPNIPFILGTVVSYLLSFVGVFFFVLLIYAGFLWMTAAGAEDKVGQAQKILQRAVIGLVLVLSAYTISNFVFSNFLTGGSGGGTEETACTGVVDGASCGTRKVCQKNKCVERCVYEFTAKASCMAVSSCDGEIVGGYCSSPSANIKCCVPIDIYDSNMNQAAAASGQSKPSGAKDCPEVGGECIPEASTCTGQANTAGYCPQKYQCCVNTCTQSQGFCTSKAACTAKDGKPSSAKGCASGSACCQNCESLGGKCFYSDQECAASSPNGSAPKIRTDLCGDKADCCFGTVNSLI